jgi:hypothetical protein
MVPVTSRFRLSCHGTTAGLVLADWQYTGAGSVSSQHRNLGRCLESMIPAIVPRQGIAMVPGHEGCSLERLMPRDWCHQWIQFASPCRSLHSR